MTIEKLKSGSYRISQMYHGQRYRITIDHRPSKPEAMKLITAEIEKSPTKITNMTFDDAASAYINAKSNVLSPATIKGYQKIRRNLPESLSDTYLSMITSAKVQTVVNELTEGHSPKTVSNAASFIVTVLKFYDVPVKAPHLPQKEKKNIYIPTIEDMTKIFSYIKGKDYEAAIILAAHGLRRSEIAALTVADLDGCTLTINKAMVEDEHGNWIIKTTKTTESTRTVVIPEDIADTIREKGYIYNKKPYTINQDLHRVQKAVGVPAFSLHKLRHFFASYMHDLGYSDKQIMSMGGWATNHVMQTVYEHALQMEKAKKDMSDSLSKLRG